MIYIYFFIMFLTLSILETRYMRNELSKEFVLLFLVTFSYTHIYNLYIIYINSESLDSSDPFSLFLFFFIFLFFFYLFLSSLLVFYLGLLNESHNNNIYFIE